MSFEYFLILVTIVYTTQMGVLLLGVRRGRDARGNAQPTVTVVIAARNEEASIRACLSSVLNQTYPKDRYSVIVANDGSSDSTQAICNEFVAKGTALSTFYVAEETTRAGKSNALAQAIDRATGEVILITDADCTVPETWVEETARRYSSDEVGLVGGITLQQCASPFSGMQSLDWAFILGAAVANASWGNLLGSIGNNLSFRKKAYDAIGGYRNVPFSVTEDYALVQAIAKTRRWKYLYPLDKKLLVMSKACPDLLTLVRQKHRWGKGGLDMKFSGFLLLAITGLMHLSPLVVLYWGKFILASFCVLVKMTIDYTFLDSILTRLDRGDQLKYFFWFEMYYLVYAIVIPFLALFGGTVVWKGRNY
jgi:cellulose synthase/poly-beta-1,6-N-acetylglucosamine synthase-like glycosyltransferase